MCKELLIEIWESRNPQHERNLDTGKDMFFDTVNAVFEDYNNVLKRFQSGIVFNNHRRPLNQGKYNVLYTDNTHGIEYFNGKMWEVKYKHPVKYWEDNKIKCTFWCVECKAFDKSCC